MSGIYIKSHYSLIKHVCTYPDINDPDAVLKPSPASDVYVRVLHHFSIFLLPYVVILSYLSKLQSVYLIPVTVYIYTTMKKLCNYNTDITLAKFCTNVCVKWYICIMYLK